MDGRCEDQVAGRTGQGYSKIDHLDIEATPYAWKITPSGAQAYVSAKGLSVPTRGETGHYDSSDYELDANGNRTDKLKPGTGQLISYDDLSFESRKMRPTGVGLAFDGGATFRWNENWTFRPLSWMWVSFVGKTP